MRNPVKAEMLASATPRWRGEDGPFFRLSGVHGDGVQLIEAVCPPNGTKIDGSVSLFLEEVAANARLKLGETFEVKVDESIIYPGYLDVVIRKK